MDYPHRGHIKSKTSMNLKTKIFVIEIVHKRRYFMKNSNNIMTIIYELLDEIIGGFLPGIYFCTYFLMCAYVILGSDVFTLSSSNSLLIGIPFLAISYVLGTLFKRGNMEKTDTLSVKYIMKKSKKDLLHTEYLSDVFEDYCKNELTQDIKDIKAKYRIPISLYYIENQKRIWNSETVPQHLVFLYVSKKIKKAYKKANKKCFFLNPLIRLFNGKLRFLNNLVDKRNDLKLLYEKLKEKIDLKVDYPYSYLKNYLIKNELEDLAAEVDWDTSNRRRTKGFITEIISLLNEKDYPGMKYIRQRSAHIRFMNSAYHSQKSLFFCALIVFCIDFLILSFRFVFLWVAGFEKEPNFLFGKQTFLFVVDKFFDYIVRIVNFEDLFVILCISAVYMLFYIVTRKFVLGNFHYQRIREIVYLLQAKNHVSPKVMPQNQTTP
jgi:hypothetical protein